MGGEGGALECKKGGSSDDGRRHSRQFISHLKLPTSNLSDDEEVVSQARSHPSPASQCNGEQHETPTLWPALPPLYGPR